MVPASWYRPDSKVPAGSTRGAISWLRRAVPRASRLAPQGLHRRHDLGRFGLAHALDHETNTDQRVVWRGLANQHQQRAGALVAERERFALLGLVDFPKIDAAFTCRQSLLRLFQATLELVDL